MSISYAGGQFPPREGSPDHVLARLIGFDVACKLSAEYGDMDHFEIPRAAGAIIAARNKHILKKFIKGKTLRLLALEYAMTERAIQKILLNVALLTMIARLLF